MEGSHTRIVRQTEQNASTLGVSVVVLEPLFGPWVRDMPILDLDDVGMNRNLHGDIYMGGSHTSIERRTKQNAATLGYL